MLPDKCTIFFALNYDLTGEMKEKLISAFILTRFEYLKYLSNALGNTKCVS